MIGEEVRSAPKEAMDNMAMSMGNNIAKESSKGGDESVVFSRQQDYLLYNCCITVLCVDQCDMAPISAHP